MSLSEFDTWLETQENIYKKRFRDKFETLCDSGLVLDPAIENKDRGIIVALRHDEKIASRIANFSLMSADFVPALVFRPSEIHTTLGALSKMTYLAEDDLDVIFGKIAGDWIDFKKCLKETRIDYRSWLINPTTIIAAGYPNESFFDLVKGINNRLNSLKLESVSEVRMAKMAHITTNRFVCSVNSSDVIESLLRWIEMEPALGNSFPVSIDIGWYEIRRGQFILDIRHSLHI